ncbi:ABC transporter substrate-binding protein [Ferviditalea candida]|uniref:ABC transporter substrate-binding protein n=1 Tax=Ferviditalea candida TaxID=3108399 RepID=A0ABU5ZKR0_9BACL|nr:ABC transporter substrate-binding protein [Paenibacillaceae bacterium T2]
MKSLFRHSFIALLIFSIALLTACGGQNTGKSESSAKPEQSSSPASSAPSPAAGDSGKVINAKIGVISYMTGPGAAYGEAITNGLNLALEEINKTYADKLKVELKIEDSAGKQEQALSAAQKLMNSENVVAIIGPTLSTEMNAVGPQANMNGVPILGTSTTANGIPQIGEFVFRDSIPESLAIPASVKKVVDKFSVKKVAIMYGNDDVFTKSGYDVMKKVAEDLKLEVVDTETFQKGQSDYKAQLTKIKSAQPQAVLCSALYNEGAVIMDQARKIGLDVPFVGGNGFNSPKVIEIAGKASEGLVVATPWFTGRQDEKVQKFVADFNAKYHKDPDQFAAQAYDGLYLMADALMKAGVADRSKLRDALAATKDFQGVLGKISFDKDGDVVMDPTVLVIKDGKFQLFE